MEITSDKFKTLKKYNKKTGVKRGIRVGCVVNTNRGVGIVTTRDKSSVWVANESDSWLMCHTYIYDIGGVELYDQTISNNNRLYIGAWMSIMNDAIQKNQDYEVAKHKAIVNGLSSIVKGKREKREISTTFFSNIYTRFIGDDYNFEICTSNPFLFDGDKILYAIGETDTIGYINGYGWIGRRKIVNGDINSGECVNVFNVDDDGDKIYD